MSELRVLGWALWMLTWGGLFTAPAAIWRPHGFLMRFIQWLLRILVLQLSVAIWFQVDTWWKALFLDSGVVGVVALAVARGRFRSATPGRSSRIALGALYVDYGIGVCVYLLFAWALTAASISEPTESTWLYWIALQIGNLAASQVASSGAFRVLSAALGEDYGIDRKQQYLLAAPPVRVALVIASIMGGPFVGFLLSLAVLIAGWFLTDHLPKETLQIYRALARRGREAIKTWLSRKPTSDSPHG
jgi:hypothetical protein